MKRNSGAVMIVVIWLSFILVTLVLSIAYSVRLRFIGARNSVRDMQAVTTTVAAVQQFKAGLRSGTMALTEQQLSFSDGVCTITPLSQASASAAQEMRAGQPVTVRFSAQVGSYVKTTDVVFRNTESGFQILLWREL